MDLEVCLWETQSLSFLNPHAAGNSSGNSPTEESNKTPQTWSTVNPEPAGADTKDVPPPPAAAARPAARSSSQKRGRDVSSGMNKSKKPKKDVSSEEHDNHILTERERRKRMRDMFANLHALLPRLTKKADKSSIVDEAVSYIHSLESTLHALENKKQERHQSTTIFPTDNQSSSLINNPHHQLQTMNIPFNNTTREAFLCDQEGSSNHHGSGNPNPNPNPNANSSSFNCSTIRVPVGFQIWTSSNVILTICGDEAQFTVCSANKCGVLSAIFFVMEKYKIDVMAANISSDGHRSIYMIQAAHAKESQDHLMEMFSVEDIYRKAADEIMQWTST